MEPTPKKNPMNMRPEAEIEPNQLLPDDVVLEIVARCGTIGAAIRCAAASKSLRRGILDAPFLRHLHGFLHRDGEDHGDDGRPFIPRLLLGLYHKSGGPRLQPSFVPVSDDAKLPIPSLAALPSPPNRDDDVGACDFGPYVPVASRRSLLVLRRRCKSTEKEHLIGRHGLHPVELSMCNPTTGERRVLPSHDVQDMSHALLDVDPLAVPSSSFKLLVAELSNNNASTTLYVQIFSSDSDSGEGGEGWEPALACPIVSRFHESRFKFGSSDGNTGRPMPVVLGNIVFWLCTSRLGDRILMWRWRPEKFLGLLPTPAWIADLPPRHWLGRPEKCLAVLPSPADAAESQDLLGIIVIGASEIEVWAEEKSGAGSAREWKLWHRIQEADIPRPMGFSSGWLRGLRSSASTSASSRFTCGRGAPSLRP